MLASSSRTIRKPSIACERERKHEKLIIEPQNVTVTSEDTIVLNSKGREQDPSVLSSFNRMRIPVLASTQLRRML